MASTSSACNSGTYESLAAFYQAQVISKLPRNCILSPAFVASYPPGSDISLAPEVCGLLSAEQIRITRCTVVQLALMLSDKEVTAVEVMTAFGMRATIAHQLTPCLTDFFLDDALKQAKALDEHYDTTGQLMGPLHGIPISLKDQVQLKGKMTSLSFLALHHNQPPATVDAQLATILTKNGALLFCHTMLPQAIMHLESESFWGRTLNPFNTNLTSGGSSGGEGALIAMRGSPIGVGSDIGGSIRSPASLCGLYGLRPSTQRVPNAGCRTYVPGRDSILGCFGPLAHSIEDIELFMSVVVGDEVSAPWRSDPALLEMPWRFGRQGDWQRGVPSAKLRVGIMRDDGEVRPVACIRNLMEAAEKQLRESDEVEVVEFPAWRMRDGWNIIRKLYFVDGGKRIRSMLHQEKTQEKMHPLTAWLLESDEPVQELDIESIWRLNIERESFRAAFAAHWNANNVDVVLSPIAPGPAPKHGESKWWAYTSHWNLVDYPSIAFPISSIPALAAPESTGNAEEYTPLSAEDKDIHSNYDIADYQSAPIGLQLIAKKYHDEELIDALIVVKRILQKSQRQQ